MYEVEIKASLSDISLRQLLSSAADLGFIYHMTIREKDVYYNGVDRNFMKTDEALRIRTCSRWQEVEPDVPDGDGSDLRNVCGEVSGNVSKITLKDKENISEENFITYKGPKLDDKSSTRIEHEIKIDDPDEAGQLFSSLGYTPVFTVDKTRREFHLSPEPGRSLPVTLCIDCVAGLSAHMELETLAPSEDAKDEALQHLFSVLDSLNIPRENLTRRSYLELLMADQAAKR